MTELGEIPVEWDIKKISEVAEIVSGGTPSTNKPEYWDNGTILWATPTDITSNKKYISVTEKSISNEGLRNSSANLLPIGSILMTSRATIGEKCINTVPMATNQGFKSFICKDNFYNEFMYYLIDTIKDKLISLASGSTFLEISKSAVSDFKIIVPPINEQQKIASILSTIDEHIEQADGLIEKTKELKKGLMQRLLTKGIGHTEFKMTEIGKIPKVWEVKSLEEISIGKGEYGINAAAKEYEQNEPRYLRITDIDDNYEVSNNEIKSVEADEDEYKKYILKENDIVFARTGNTTGKSYLYEKCDGELVFAGFLIKFTINPLLYDSSFLKYYVQTKYYWDWVQKMSLRSGQPGINSKEYSSLLVPVPPVDEQYKIATILRKVDNRIEKYDIKRQKLQHLKKGLMQKLLTGKLRVC
ncbi:restriction endonuclease subunit S [Clostridiaceae bacterium 35-E11]